MATDRSISTAVKHESSHTTAVEHDNKRVKYDHRPTSAPAPAVTRFERKQNRYANHVDTGRHDWGNANSSATSTNITPATAPIVKQQPNYNLTGLLSQPSQSATNNGSKRSALYSEPVDACKPDKQWRMYVYKSNKLIDTIQLTQSHMLIGADPELCYIHCLHDSINSVHAVVQYRRQSKISVTGETVNTGTLYVMDLKSRYHTSLNQQRLEPHRYYELLDKDVLMFGESTRKYVLLNIDSKINGTNK